MRYWATESPKVYDRGVANLCSEFATFYRAIFGPERKSWPIIS